MSASRNAVKQRFNIIGNDARLNEAVDIAVQVAPTDVTVLVIGENGTGKDNFSKIIHQYGKRKHKPFIAINCGAIPEGTMDSELFGHEKGSFTSAHEMRKGYFEEVNGGVIFLDEIAEMPLSTQSRLLRLLENGEYLRVGSSKVMTTDVRVIAATNKNLITAIQQGKFREDLYFRLNTVTILVPPLRERGEDIELLFRFFAGEFGERYGRTPIQLLPEARPLLHDYHWPGNVRELRNFAEKVTVLADETVLGRESLARFLPQRNNLLPAPLVDKTDNRNDNRNDDRRSFAGDGLEFDARETELVLKVLFELKNDVSLLKNAFYSLLQPQKTLSLPGADYNDLPPANNNRKETPRTESYRDVPYEITRTPIVSRTAVDIPLAEETTHLLEESLSLEKKEKDMIARALLKHGQNRKKAAEELGISERTLYRKIKIFGLEA